MTGAPIPDGADGVVMVEDTETVGDRVRILRAAHVGDHVRPAGGDFAAGATVFPAGERLAPAHLGVLASIGVTSPFVTRRPVVAVLSTGDEVRSPDTITLPPGAIRDANRPMLVSLLTELGVEVRDMGIVPDDARLLRSTFDEAAATCDMVVTSGGVSMGSTTSSSRFLLTWEGSTSGRWRCNPPDHSLWVSRHDAALRTARESGVGDGRLRTVCATGAPRCDGGASAVSSPASQRCWVSRCPPTRRRWCFTVSCSPVPVWFARQVGKPRTC